MRRTILILAATAVALVLLLSFKTTPAPIPQRGALRAAGPPRRSAAASGSVPGSVIDTPYGPVQVAVTLARHRITSVRALLLPQDTALSQQISAYVGPILRHEALAAQGARIDAVSGATYTSDGYRQSLQAALDAAHA